MSTCVIWLDSARARIFKIDQYGIKKVNVKLNEIQHSNGNHNRNMLNSSHKYFSDVAGAIDLNHERILILGSGVAKFKFEKYLQRKFKLKTVNIISVETIKRCTDRQILQSSRDFFKKHSLFNRTAVIGLMKSYK